MKLSFFLLFICLLIIRHLSEAQISQYNRMYTSGKIDPSEKFPDLSPAELRLDSVYSAFKPGTPFRENRSRIYCYIYINGELQKNSDSCFQKGLPAFCDCFTSADTLFISTGAGFFGGFGFYITVEKNSFESSFYEYIDDVKPYKSNLSDTAFTNVIHVKNKYQYLIFEGKPAFKPDEVVIGQLFYTTKPYYEEDNSLNLRNIFVKGKIFFTCRPRAKMPMEMWYFRQ